MLFNSLLFLFGFLPAALFIYWIADRKFPNQRLLVLLCISFVFYGYWDYRFIPLLAFSILINWLVAEAFWKSRRSVIIFLALAANLAVLGYFKYSVFAASVLAPIVTVPKGLVADFALPLGISFFTFHHVMYLTDLKAGIAPRYDLVRYGLYIAFFPQVLAGPLVRWSEIMHQLEESPYSHPAAMDRFSQGLFLLVAGLAKKVLIADPLAAVSDPMFHIATRGVEVTFMDAWQGTLAFTFQIYFDFSGYTDMALGIALMFGILLPPNFNVPYRATSLQDFWRRWHMTLSRFLRDYLYIPLGGNRHGLTLQLAALLTTMVLGGLWHGAGYTFIVWGALHGLALCLLVLWGRVGIPLPALVGWLLTFTFVIFTWVAFRAQTLGAATLLWKGMLGMHPFHHRFASPSGWIPIAIGFAFAVIGPASQTISERLHTTAAAAAATGLLFFVVLIRLGGGGAQKFIYFQF